MPIGVYKHKGHPITEETKIKIGIANKGKQRQPFSEERRADISRRMMGHGVSEETRKKLSISSSIALKGRKLSDEHKKNIGKAVKGRVVLPKTRLKLKKIHSGNHYSPGTEFKKGHIIPEEQKVRIRNKLLGRYMGDKNPSWKGGKSFEPYTVDWTKTLKRAIKERDHYSCNICESQEDLVIHHKDCNKKNCNPNNLITLCRRCHSKVHKALDDLKKSETPLNNL
jgi:hypothetical protein